MLKAMDVFGGGLGAHGEVCGAVIGGLAVVGRCLAGALAMNIPISGCGKMRMNS
jgi:hypothetical protein